VTVLAEGTQGHLTGVALDRFALQGENPHRDRLRKVWKIVTAHGILNAVEFDLPNGKIQEFVVSKVQ